MAEARTEPASPRRLADALRAGVRPISRDAVSWMVVASAWLLLSWQLPALWTTWKRLLLDALQQTGSTSLRLDALWARVGELGLSLAPIALTLMVVTVLTWAVQGGLRFRSRSSAARVHVRAMSGLRTAWFVVKACVVVAAFASVTHHALRAVLSTPTSDLGYALRVLEGLARLGGSRVGVTLALLVVADAIVARVLWRESLRMTRDELRRELRDTEADPHLGRERRRRQQYTALES